MHHTSDIVTSTNAFFSQFLSLLTTLAYNRNDTTNKVSLLVAQKATQFSAMRLLVGHRLVCAILTVLFASVNCFANVAHGLPSPQSTVSGATKRGLRAHVSWDSRDVEAPFIKSSALIPLPLSKKRNIYTFFTFSWVRALMEVGNKKTLGLADLWVLDETQLMANASKTLDTQFDIEKKSRAWDPTLTRSNLLADFWYSPLTRAVLKQ
jgi:hypothetical protein